MEQLRGLTWGFDSVGLPVSDFATILAVDPVTTMEGVVTFTGGRPVSQHGRLRGLLDREGKSLGGGQTPPTATAYVRRWSVEPLPTNPNNTLILQVLVFSVGDRPNSGQGRFWTESATKLVW